MGVLQKFISHFSQGQRCRFILCLLLGGAGVGHAQRSLVLSGQVVDSASGAPLAMASVVVADSSGLSIVHFTQCDASGFFRVEVDAAEDCIWLHARYMGYARKAQRVCESRSKIRFALVRDSTVLREVVISDRKQAVRTEGDTISFWLPRFRDSTEYNVEDVLRKLPGIEVESNGTVKFRGKPVERVLIDGSDLFGRQYPIATRNIRADYIEQVDVIQNWQPNPSLSQLNMSESVALDLRVSEAKKNILVGTLNAGGTLGAGVRGGASTNVFWIRPHVKTVLLADGGNIPRNIGPGEMDAIYDATFAHKDLRAPLSIMPERIQMLRLDNPGVDRHLLDNSVGAFATLRTDVPLGKHWRLQGNATGAITRDRQWADDSQRFLFGESVYGIQNYADNRFGSSQVVADVGLRRYADANKTFFESFASADVRWLQGTQYLQQTVQGDRRVSINRMAGRNHTLQTGAAYTYRHNSNHALRAQARFQALAQPQQAAFINRDFAAVFDELNGQYRLHQRVYTQSTDATAGLLWVARWGKYLMSETELHYHAGSARADTKLQRADESPIQSGLFEPDTVRLEGPILRSTWRYENLYHNSRLLYEISAPKVREKDRETQPVLQRLEWSWRREFEHIAWTIGFQSDRRIASAAEQLRTALLPTPFTIMAQPEGRSTPITGNSLFTRIGPPVRGLLFDWRWSARWGFGRNLWLDDANFLNSIVIHQPYFARGAQFFQSRIYAKRFFLRQKTWLTFDGGYGQSRNFYRLQQQQARIDNRHLDLSTSLVLALSEHWGIKFNGLLDYRVSDLSVSDARQRVLTWQGNYGLVWQVKGWNVTLSVAHMAGKSGELAIQGPFSSRLEAVKTLKFNKKSSYFRAAVYNLLNARYYQNLTVSPYWIFEQRVEALPFFLFVRMDLPI